MRDYTIIMQSLIKQLGIRYIMKKIFISYSRKSQSEVAVLADDLTLLGYSVWFDKELIGGHNWWDVILENICFCDVFLFTITQDSIQTTPCQSEFAYAQALNKPIIPILLDKTINISLLSPTLQALQFVDYTAPSKESLGKLNRALISLPHPAPLPDILPPKPEMPLSPVAEINQRIAKPHLSAEEQTDILHAIQQLNAPNDAEFLRQSLLQHADFSLNIPASQVQSPIAEQMLYIHRQHHYGYSMRAFRVYLDGVKIADLHNNETLKHAVTSGKHELTIKLDFMQTAISFDLSNHEALICFDVRLGGLLMNKIIVEQTTYELLFP